MAGLLPCSSLLLLWNPEPWRQSAGRQQPGRDIPKGTNLPVGTSEEGSHSAGFSGRVTVGAKRDCVPASGKMSTD